MTIRSADDGVWSNDLTALQPMPLDLAEAQLEILKLRDEVIGLHAIAGTLRGEIELRMAQERAVGRVLQLSDIEHLIYERDHYKEQLEMVKRTRSWRVGQVVVSPFAFVRRLFGRRDGGVS